MSVAMYQDHFDLQAMPFSIAPDPAYLYMSPQHKEALAHLLYGLSTDGGFVLLTGEVGAGKTTVCRCLLDELPADVTVAFIYHPKLSVAELLSSICDEFGIEGPAAAAGSVKQFVDCISRFLLDQHAQGRNCVLIIDEAQNLSAEVLEQLRLLTNLETNERKLLQILLIGQPELLRLLSRSELRQLSQRIVARYHLEPLRPADLAPYLRHRLATAGGRVQLFPAKLVPRLYELSRGVPRTINLICDRALLGASVQGMDHVDARTLAAAALEVVGVSMRVTRWRAAVPAGVCVAALLTTAAAVAVVGYSRLPGGADAHAVERGPMPSAVRSAAMEPVAALLPRVPASAPSQAMPAMVWSDVSRGDAGEASAFAALYQKWGALFDDALPPCDQGGSKLFACHEGHGGLIELRQFNLPAVLHVSDSQGRELLLPLLSLTADEAVLQWGGVERRVPLDRLAAHWSGDYTLLWRGPTDARAVFQLGSRGAGVAWLRSRLALWGKEKLPVTRLASFDKPMQQRLRIFQAAEGLEPDGVAGMKTLVRLAVRTDPQAPRLSSTGVEP